MTKAEFTRDEVIDFIDAFGILRIDAATGQLSCERYAYDESIAPKWLIDGLTAKLRHADLLDKVNVLLSKQDGATALAVLTAALEKYAK